MNRARGVSVIDALRCARWTGYPHPRAIKKRYRLRGLRKNKNNHKTINTCRGEIYRARGVSVIDALHYARWSGYPHPASFVVRELYRATVHYVHPVHRVDLRVRPARSQFPKSAFGSQLESLVITHILWL